MQPLWCVAAESSTSTSTSTSSRSPLRNYSISPNRYVYTASNSNSNSDNNNKYVANSSDNFILTETIGSAIISLSLIGEVNIWQPLFLNKNNLISKTEQIFTLFTLQFKLTGSYLSRNVKKIPSESSSSSFGTNVPNFENFPDGKSNDAKFDFYDDKDCHKTNKNSSNNNDMKNSSNENKNNDNNKYDEKVRITAVGGAIDPSCQTIFISYSDGSLQQWPVLGMILKNKHNNNNNNNNNSNNNKGYNSNINIINDIDNISNKMEINNVSTSNSNNKNTKYNFHSFSRPNIAVCDRNFWEDKTHSNAITTLRVWTKERNWNLNDSRNRSLEINDTIPIDEGTTNNNKNMKTNIVSNVINDFNILISNSTLISCSKDFSLILWKFMLCSIDDEFNNINKDNHDEKNMIDKDDDDDNIDNNNKNNNNNDNYNYNDNNNNNNNNNNNINNNIDNNNNSNDNYNGGINSSNFHSKKIGFSFFLKPIMCRKFYFSSSPSHGICFLLPSFPLSSTSSSFSYLNDVNDINNNNNNNNDNNSSSNNNDNNSLLTKNERSGLRVWQISAILNGSTITVTRNITKNIFSSYISPTIRKKDESNYKIPNNNDENENESKNTNENYDNDGNRNIILNKIETEKKAENLKLFFTPLTVPIQNILSTIQLFSKNSSQELGSSMNIIKGWDRLGHGLVFNGSRSAAQGKKNDDLRFSFVYSIIVLVTLCHVVSCCLF